jgi:MYXO-CTERM domain-containing protein
VPRSVLRLLSVAGVTCAAVCLTAVPALAHVTVDSPGATQGGFAGLAGLVLGLGARRRRATVGEHSPEAVSTGVQ